VGELVANAVVHASGPVSIHLSRGIEELRIGVHDGHPGRPVRRRPTADDEAGRGLDLVDGLIRPHGGTWGVIEDRTGPGKTVHVIVPLPGRRALPRHAQQDPAFAPCTRQHPADPLLTPKELTP